MSSICFQKDKAEGSSLKLMTMIMNLSYAVVCLLLSSLIVYADSTQPPYACDSSTPSTKSYAFCKSTLPIGQRAKDLVSRLTLDEKISQLVNTAPPIPRLGIPAYEWWNEALHGISNVGLGIRFNGSITSATSFPQIILTAASFDSKLWYRIAQVIGTEARAMYNAGQAQGLTFWAPNINIFRDPRWGRGQETPGEDPLVTGKYAVAYVRGLQGDSFEGRRKLKGHLQASACCKHFTAYDLDNWNNVDRYVFDAKVTKQDLADTYQPPFQSCVQQGQASGIMCAYNRVNGVPNCANFNLLTNIARRQWGFQGYISSDCGGVSIIYEKQGYAKSPEEAIADVLTAGMDVECGSYLQQNAKSAVIQRKVAISEIDRALINLFSVRMRLGLFDGNPTKLLYGNIGSHQVCSKKHQDLALAAARDSIVLLKNSGRLLPLDKSTSKMSFAVIGPKANGTNTPLGDYVGPPCKLITPLEGLQSYVKDVTYLPGCQNLMCSSATLEEAAELAKKVDYVVLVLGLDQSIERESLDRLQLDLPGKQQDLINTVASASKKPVILVIMSGGPVDITPAKYDKKIGSIIWAGYPGQAGGTALAEIIFGDHNPGGRLPLTWYPKDFIKVPMTDMRMRPDPSSGYPGRTYRFYTGKKVFEYGYGLSYSSYAYEFVTVTQSKLYLNESKTYELVDKSDKVRYKLVSDMGSQICQRMLASVKVGVTNHGTLMGKHPVLLFTRPEKQRIGNPIKQLADFQSVKLKAGERAEIEFNVSPCEHLSRANEEGLKLIEEGSYFLMVGNEEHPINIIF